MIILVVICIGFDVAFHGSTRINVLLHLFGKTQIAKGVR
jgi:hypothetical protein